MIKTSILSSKSMQPLEQRQKLLLKSELKSKKASPYAIIVVVTAGAAAAIVPVAPAALAAQVALALTAAMAAGVPFVVPKSRQEVVPLPSHRMYAYEV